MSANGDGKDRKPLRASRKAPRTPSHAPTNRKPAGAEDRPGDVPGGQDEAVVSDVSNNGNGPSKGFAPGNTIGHRFGKGNSYGKGNPNARRIHELRMQFLDAVHADTIPSLAKRLQVQALDGDMDATTLLLSYCLGKPTAAVEISGVDGEPLGLNIASVTQVVLSALSSPEYAEARIRIAADLMRLDDAGDPHA